MRCGHGGGVCGCIAEGNVQLFLNTLSCGVGEEGRTCSHLTLSLFLLGHCGWMCPGS